MSTRINSRRKVDEVGAAIRERAQRCRLCGRKFDYIRVRYGSDGRCSDCTQEAQP